MAEMSTLPKIEIWRDPMTTTLHIKIEIPELFAVSHFFAVQEFEKRFWDIKKPLSDRLTVLARFVRATLEE
jgi:hypothetical protein